MTPHPRRRWRRIALGIGLPLLSLLLVAYICLAWALSLMDALLDYSPPIWRDPAAGDPLELLTNALVVVIIDGLREDTAQEMTFLNELGRLGATATVIGQAPSYSQNAWTTIITGAGPQINGAPQLNIEDFDHIQPIRADHIFAAAKRAGLSTAIFGHYWWERLVPPSYRDDAAFVRGEDEAADQIVLEAALHCLKDRMPSLTFIHLDQVDLAGHRHGAQSIEYRQAAWRVDTYLRTLANTIDLQSHTLVVIADHGHIRHGGHGGADRDVLRTRLVAIGSGIRPGILGTVRQTDIAPTLAALLGTSIPSRTEGHIVQSLLAWDDSQRARASYALARQRLLLAQEVLGAIGYPLTDVAPGERLESLAELVRTSAWEEVASEAELIISELDARVLQARGDRVAMERRERIWMPVVYALVLAIIGWRMKHRLARLHLGPALLAAGGPHVLFLLAGHPYSFSMIQSAETFMAGIAGRTLAGMLLGWIWAITRQPANDRLHTVEIGLAFAWQAIALMGILVVGIVWWQGTTISWYLPDLTILFVHLMLLAQLVFACAGAAILAPIGGLLPQNAVNRLRTFRMGKLITKIR